MAAFSVSGDPNPNQTMTSYKMAAFSASGDPNPNPTLQTLQTISAAQVSLEWFSLSIPA